MDHPLARVRMPTNAELNGFVAAINSKYPVLTTEWGAMDGLKIKICSCANPVAQNNNYNGWLHGHFRNNLLLFSPDGLVQACYFNAPGTMHDSSMAIWGGVYDKIDAVYQQTGFCVVADSAFARENRNSILPSYQTNLNHQGQMRQHQDLYAAATSMRQLSKWGMHGFKSSFRRLESTFPYKERGELRVIMQMIILLYNFRASTVGQNQIQSSFYPNLI